MQKNNILIFSVLSIVLCFFTFLITYNFSSANLQTRGVRTAVFRNDYKKIDEQLNFVTVYDDNYKSTNAYSTFAFYSMDEKNKIDVYGKFEVVNRNLLKLNNQNGNYYGVLHIYDDNAVLITKDGRKYNFSVAGEGEHYIDSDYSKWHTKYGKRN